MINYGTIDITKLIIMIVIMGSVFSVVIIGIFIFLRRRNNKIVSFEAIKFHELISLIVSICYVITVCVTVVLLAIQNHTISQQTKFTSQSVESNVFGIVTGHTLAQDELFIKEPQLRPYFYSGKDIDKSDPLYDKVYAMAEYTLDFFDSLSTQLKEYPNLWLHEKKTWEANIIDSFAWSPVLCRYLAANKDWYSDELHALKKRGDLKRQQGHAQQVIP